MASDWDFHTHSSLLANVEYSLRASDIDVDVAIPISVLWSTAGRQDLDETGDGKDSETQAAWTGACWESGRPLWTKAMPGRFS